MSQPPSNKSPSAGGVFMAVLTLVGAVLGGLMGQPSIGLLVGLGLGTAIAVLIWWKERAR
ncbi:MAG: hypothetical protein LKF30_07480 [Sphingobium sp.]|jgi:hypothetical protein|nr:hypothetical protein [Sphingobium sp.]MCI1272231.1 hypothetical protein [Sphingobium sp.]MCI1754493.1 hypothetical protein [Sphingobium sp.]MCI2054027.1 hypothetical protein [Sphingobium sp.]